MKTTLLLFLSIFISVYFNVTAYATVSLIKSDFYKDGGTRCVEYEKNGTLIMYCIDSRLEGGTHDVFIGGYPGAANSKAITKIEMISVYNDVAEIMKSDDYKKYSAMTHDEMRALIKFGKDYRRDEQKMKEYRTASSYRSLSDFRSALLVRLLIFNWLTWSCIIVITSIYIYRRNRTRSK